MVYRDAVKYIEQMKPDHINAVAEECLRTRKILRAALPTLEGLRGTVRWASDAADLYERRLRETVDLLEGLHAGFTTAGEAVDEYVRAQKEAQRLVADGVTVE